MKIRAVLPTFIVIAKLIAFLALTRAVLRSEDSTKTNPLPTVKEVMDHYVTALGGHDVIFKHKSMTIRGQFELSDKGPSLDRTVYYKDGRILYKVAMPVGVYQEGYDGSVAWRLHPKSGPAILKGNEVKSKERDADMYYPARILQYFKSMEVMEVTDFEGHSCYHLKGTNKWGIVNEQFYDTTTGVDGARFRRRSLRDQREFVRSGTDLPRSVMGSQICSVNVRFARNRGLIPEMNG